MKKAIVISSVLLGVIFLAGCGRQQIGQTQPTTPASMTQQPVTNQPVQQNEATNNWQIYSNAKSEYSISVPKDWTYMEELPAPYVATHFFGASDENKQLLFVDRFETNKQSNDEAKKDLMAWAKKYMSFTPSSEGKIGVKDCKDGTARIADNNNAIYQSVIIDCPKADTESYNIFTLDRYYLIESPLSYKKQNAELYDSIYKSFKVE